MKKRIIALVSATIMLLVLSACSVSSSTSATTSFSTSKTDENGNTTTKTVTNEIGVSAGTDGIKTINETRTDETTTPASSMADFFAPKEDWYDLFSEGGEGETEEGDRIYFAYDDPEDIRYAMLLAAYADGDIIVRDGDVTWNEEEECLELYDTDVDVTVPFIFLDSDDEDAFVIRFLASDAAVTLNFVDQDTIINDIYDILANSSPAAQPAEETAE